MTNIEPAAARYVGTRVHRVEDSRLLRGRGTFVDDVVRPGTAHAVFLRSPYARARIRRIDSSAALALPGVRAVFTGADLNPGVHEQWYTSTGKNVPDTPRPPMAEEEVRFVGDPVALVVAADSYVAEDAIELVDVDYEALAPVVDYRAARSAEAQVHAQYSENVAGALGGAMSDDLVAVFDSASHDVRLTIEQQAYAPFPRRRGG